MNKFKPVVIKDWHIHKKTLLIPFWITAVFYLLMLISFGIAYIRGDVNLQLAGIQMDVSSPMINYIANYSLTIFPAIMGLIITIIISQSALNEDIKRNCELFHRSQAVSDWERTGSKYLVAIGGNWTVMIIISLFNFMVVNLVLAFLKQADLAIGIPVLLQRLVGHMKILLVVGSICFFLSVIFRDAAFFKGLAILIALNIFLSIINVLFGWKLPLPLGYVFDLFQNATPMESMQGGGMLREDLIDAIRESWVVLLFSLKTLYQLLVSAALFVGATYIYKNREIR